MTHWRDYISQLAPENTLRQELEGVAGQKEAWNTLLMVRVDLSSDKWKRMDGWRTNHIELDSFPLTTV